MTRLEAKQIYAQTKTDDDVRALLCDDLFYLLVYGLNRPDIDNDFLYARCREVQSSPNGHLDLWAREHYKSTIITVGLTIQEFLKNSNLTVGIFSHTKGIARAFLRQIKRELEVNEELQALFPHITPPNRGESRSWSDDAGLILKRSNNPKEASLEAWGLVDGQPTGKHFDVLIYDDVVTLESVSTPEQIKKTTDAWRLSLNLGARGGVIRMIGTRYHASDTYAEILDQGSVTPRIISATADGMPEGEPVFLDRETLAKKRRDMGSYVFACQMLQNPLADNAMGFNVDWFIKLPLENINWQPMNIYMIVDPASTKKEYSDYTSIWIIGLNTDDSYYIIDGVRDRLNLAERADKIFEFHRKYKPKAVGYEQYGMQADIEHIQYRMTQENYRFNIAILGGKTPKHDRIRRLVPIFEQGRIFFPQRIMKLTAENKAIDLVDTFFREEYKTFPVGAHDDMLDCMARILDVNLGAIFPMPQQHSVTLQPENFFA